MEICLLSLFFQLVICFVSRVKMGCINPELRLSMSILYVIDKRMSMIFTKNVHFAFCIKQNCQIPVYPDLSFPDRMKLKVSEIHRQFLSIVTGRNADCI